MITNKNFPSSAGVYFFKDANANIVYIGKAKNLKNRLNSYFFSSDQKVVQLLACAVAIEYIITPTEIEALFLEAQLIKQHQPPFNRLLKSGNPYSYIFFSHEALPTISVVRTKKKKGEYFGPFLTKKDAHIVVEYLKKSFQLTICTKKIDAGCLQYHINICAGSCKKDFDLSFYIMRLDIARQILNQNYQQATQQLAQEITASNQQLNFERSQHLAHYQQHLQSLITTLQTLHTTQLTDLPHFANATTQEQAQLYESNIALLSQVKQRLGLDKIPYTIDCFDISHMQSQSIVGSCVRFLNGRPDTKNFRHFNIKSIIEQNDYAALAEIVSRRYRIKSALPDLIIIDGGKGQLNATNHLVDGTEIISIAKGDGRKVGAETIFFGNGTPPLEVDIHQPADRLLLEIRDYAHHFAITHHRKRQKITKN